MALGTFTHELLLDIASDIGGKQKEFERSRETSRVNLASVWQKSHGGTFDILAVNSINLLLGDVPSPAKGLYLEVSADCDITLNGLGSPILVRRVAGQTLVSKLFLEVDISSISILAGAAAVTGTYRVWGDETP